MLPLHGAWVPPLVEDPRSHKLWSTAKHTHTTHTAKHTHTTHSTHTHTHTHTHTVKYYSAVRKEEILPFATTSMDHEGITLSKITQRKTNIYNVTYMWILKKLNSPKHKLEW